MVLVTLLNGSRVRAVQMAALFVYLAVCVSVVCAAQASAGTERNVWDGVFTTAQADRGRVFFSANCAECHGSNLEGGEATALSGDKFWADWTEQTVGELLTYVSKNMPFSEDGSLAGTLPTSIYADIVAHILRTNGFPDGTQELTPASGVGVPIVRKDGSGELPASTLAHVVGCLAPRGADGSWLLVKATRPERVSADRGDPNRDAPLGDREYALRFVLTPLSNFVGHRMSVTGLLLGEGGVAGLNVSTVKSMADTCN